MIGHEKRPGPSEDGYCLIEPQKSILISDFLIFIPTRKLLNNASAGTWDHQQVFDMVTFSSAI